MLVSNDIQGNIYTSDQFGEREIDFLELDWFDVEKRVIRAVTIGKREIGFRNFADRLLEDGDVLVDDGATCIALRILPCKSLVIKPRDAREMAIVCFEIGNRHLPMTIDDKACLVVAYESPLHELLKRGNYVVEISDKVISQAQTLKIHEWSVQTSFKITLAPTIDESIIDIITD